MTVENIYKSFLGFYQSIEADYSDFILGEFEWESLHLRYLFYYLMKYDIRDMQYFTYHHYRTAYRMYVEGMAGGYGMLKLDLCLDQSGSALVGLFFYIF